MPEILMPDEAARIRAALLEGQAVTSLRNWGRILTARLPDTTMAFIHHPLGFICVPAYRDAAQGICLHVWLPEMIGPMLTTSEMHAHSWNLASYVLTGEIVQHLASAEFCPQQPTHRVCTVRSWGGLDYIEPTQQMVRLKPGPEEVIRTDMSYTLPAGKFHRTEVVTGLTATIVFAEYLKGPEFTLADPDIRAHSVSREPCTAQEAAAVREKLASLGYEAGRHGA